jgi:hypothetical protein
LVALLIVASLAMCPVSASDMVQIEHLSSFLLTDVRDVVIEDSLAYCALLHGMAILNLSDPASPSLVSELIIPYGGYRIGVDGGTVCLTDYAGTLRLINVTDPAAPTVLDVFDLGAILPDVYVSDIEIQGDYAYLAAWYEGLQIVDISDPSNPAVVGGLDQGRVKVVKVVDTIAYLGTDGASGDYEFLTVNVSDPTSPTLLSHRFHGNAVDLIVQGDVAYLAGSKWILSLPDERGLFVFDVSDPANPIEEGHYEKSHPYGVWAEANRAFFLCGGGLNVLDVTDPSSPDSIGGCSVYGYGAVMGGTVGDVLWILHQDYLTGFDMSVDSDPIVTGQQIFPYEIPDMHISGNYAYIAGDWAGLLIADVSNPLSPEVIGQYSPDDLGPVISVWVDAGLAYLGTGLTGVVIGPKSTLADPFGGIVVVDVSDPSNPLFAGTCYECPPGDDEIVVDGGYLYGDQLGWFCDPFGGCGVVRTPLLLDVHDPVNPVILEGPLNVKRRNIASGMAYLTSTDSLLVYQMDNPAAPLLIGHCVLPADVEFGALNGNSALVYHQDGYQTTLFYVDVSSPTSPYLTGTALLPDSADWVDYIDPFALMKHNTTELIVADPFNPIRRDTLQHFSFGRVYSGGDYIYTDGGLVSILQINASPCCGYYSSGQTGNTDCDSGGNANLADITILIDHVYLSRTSLCCQANGNVDGSTDGIITLNDITKLIDHVYISHAETATCQ